MQLKAAELIGNIRKASSNSQALYMQLAGMIDELAGARYARFINKRFSELGAEPFEKVLEESRDLWSGRNLEELKEKLTNAGKKEIVNIRRRAAKCFNANKELTEISEVPNIMNRSWEKEKWRVNSMEMVKENAALSGSRSSRVRTVGEDEQRCAWWRLVCSEKRQQAR